MGYGHGKISHLPKDRANARKKAIAELEVLYRKHDQRMQHTCWGNVMYRRGDIYYIDFGSNINSSKECGFRPALIVSNNVANKYSPVVTVIPLTAQVKKKLRQLPMFSYRGKPAMGLSGTA